MLLLVRKGTPEWARSSPLCTVSHPKMPIARLGVGKARLLETS